MSGDWLGEPSDDWLDEPEARYVGVIEAAENERRISAEAAVNDIAQNVDLLPAVSKQIEVPVDFTKRSEALQTAWGNLSPAQRVFLETLRQHRFNALATTRALSLTGWAVSYGTVKRWMNQDDFGFVHKVMKTVAAGNAVDRERLLLRAEEIAEEALEPTPILHKGLPTGFYENQKDTALRANEQLMKTQKMLGNDDTPQGQNQGPALIIQVVQRDGVLIDVMPRGVTIDLPPPDGT